MKESSKFILGYLIGIFIFFIVIPYGLYRITEFDVFLGKISIVNNDIIRYFLSSILCLIGLIFILWSNIYLFTIGKGGPAEGFGVSISPKTKKLVTSGPYKYSRNPMVFGALGIYFSFVIYLNSIVGIIILLFILPFSITYLKLSEEKRLHQDFGEEFVEYQKKVSFLIPLKWLKKSNKR